TEIKGVRSQIQGNQRTGNGDAATFFDFPIRSGQKPLFVGQGTGTPVPALGGSDMNDEPLRASTTSYVYDSHGQLIDVTRAQDDVELLARTAAELERRAPAAFAFSHDPDTGVFRLSWPDGTVEVFRDKPVRHLCVEPDETGAMRPVRKFGRPVY